MINIVTNYKLISEFKRSRFFRINLGISATVDKGGNSRVLNENDKFAYSYNLQYKTTIFGQGNIGDIKIYCDHYISEDVLAVYQDVEEFIIPFDFKIVKENSIDFYIGYILKEVEKQYEERVKDATEKKMEPVKTGNPDLISKNPGSVRYEDIKEWLDTQNKNRFSL